MIKKSILSIFIILCIISSTFINVSAETIRYNGFYRANKYYYETNSNGTPVTSFFDLTIVTDDENAYGYVYISPFGNMYYSGLITYYSGLQNTTSSSPITGSFTGTYNSVAEETTLNSTQLNSLLNAINSINTTDSNILSAINSMKMDIMSILNNIDAIMDTISWVSTDMSFQISSDGQNWVDSEYLTISGQNYAYIKFSGAFNPYYLYKLDMKIGATLIRREIDLLFESGYMGQTNTSIVADNNMLYYPTHVQRYNYETNFIFTGAYSNITYNPVIKISWSPSNEVRIYKPTGLSYLSNNDIEYWELISFLESHYYNSEEYNNKIDELNDNIQDLNDLEQGYNDSLDSALEDIDFNIDISNNQDFPDLNDSSNYFTNTATELFNIPFIKYPALLALFMGVMKIIL